MPGVFPRSRIQFPNPEILKYTNECKNQCTNFSLICTFKRRFFEIFQFRLIISFSFYFCFSYLLDRFYYACTITANFYFSGEYRSSVVIQMDLFENLRRSKHWYFCSTVYLYFCIFKFLFNISFTQLTKLSL